ncbi:putative cytochrome c oxidase subunit 5C-4 [Fagus crenata]
MAAHNIAHAAYQGPSVIKEIFYGLSLMAGYLCKRHHWNQQKRTKEFYDMLEKGEISVVVEDE